VIYNYEIRQYDNEEFLYIYLDFNNEFANFDFNKKRKNMEIIIKKFLKKNNISFNGIKVIIMVGGIVMGTLVLGRNDFSNTKNNNLVENQVYIEKEEQDNSVDIMDEIIEEDTNFDSSIKEDLDNNNSTLKDDESTNINNSLNNNKENISIDKGQSINKDDVNEKDEMVNKEDYVEKDDGTIDKKEEDEEVEINEKIFVTIHRTNGIVETIELEEYVIGVVGAEMPASFQVEALKAQAIIARTYALKALKTNKALTDNSSTQNYKDINQLKQMWGNNFNTYYNKIKNAVNSTKGIYLTYKGQIIEAVYHSTSNGYTEASENVWGNFFPYLVSVESPYDNVNPSFEKEVFFSYDDIGNKLQFSVNKETIFNIVQYTSGKRVQIIEINGNNYTGVQFRNLLGLRSADFNIEKTDTGIKIITKGYGHGVGLSQYGANGMAKNGYGYKQILKHYYKDITISNI